MRMPHNPTFTNTSREKGVLFTEKKLGQESSMNKKRTKEEGIILEEDNKSITTKS